MSGGRGKWQRMLLGALAEHEAIPVTATATRRFERPLTPAEYAALNRAAGSLAESGRAERISAWDHDYRGRRTHLTWLLRPGLTAEDVGLSEVHMRGRPGRPNVERGENAHVQRSDYHSGARRLRPDSSSYVVDAGPQGTAGLSYVHHIPISPVIEIGDDGSIGLREAS